MSTPLAVAAVTAVLRSFLQNSVIEHDLAAVLGGTVTISSEQPDRIGRHAVVVLAPPAADGREAVGRDWRPV